MTSKSAALLWCPCLFISLVVLMIPNSGHCYCVGDLRSRDIAGVWRLKPKLSYLPSLKENQNTARPMKEFTVYPPPVEKKPLQNQENDARDDCILLLLREDGNFVQYEGIGTKDDKTSSRRHSSLSLSSTSTSSMMGGITMKGCWGFVDGRLILAADRPKDVNNLRSDAKRHDTILAGEIKAKCTNPLKNGKEASSGSNSNTISSSSSSSSTSSTFINQQDVHLTVEGEISIGKFFYPQSHPSFFEQPMVGATPTGSFELRQILGNLNTQVDSRNGDDELVEKFRKADLMNKRYFLTSYPLANKRQKRKRWSIKYNQYVDEKPPSRFEKEREEIEKNSPMQIKAFEVELYANNTFSSITGLGDTILRGKWSIIGEERDQLWMSVWRFGFGRSVSGSTFSEGLHLNHQDDVSYWGKIYEVDAAVDENSIHDDPCDWKGTRIEVNGAVMLGIGLEPCSIARFTMIEKTEQDDDEDEDDEEVDDLPLSIGSFE